MDACSTSSDKCHYIYGGVLMIILMRGIHPKCPQMDPFVLHHEDYRDSEAWVSLAEIDLIQRKVIGRSGDYVVSELVKRNTIPIGKEFDLFRDSVQWPSDGYERRNDTGLSNEPIPITNTLDPKSGHYDAGGIETIEILKAKLTKEQYKGYLLGNIIKYSTRANYKDQFNRDIEKINVYSDQLKQLNEEDNG